MWLSALFGPLSFVLLAILYFVDPDNWLTFSSRQTLFLIGSFALSFAVEGIVFTWLRMRGYLRFCDE
jgi:hypothetical protein